jgi:hypothetical protein
MIVAVIGVGDDGYGGDVDGNGHGIDDCKRRGGGA